MRYAERRTVNYINYKKELERIGIQAPLVYITIYVLLYYTLKRK